MATLEEAIREQLVSYAPLFAVVGERVIQSQVSEVTILPAVSFIRISTTTIKHRDGGKFGPTRFQFDGWAESQTEAMFLRGLIKGALFKWQRQADPRVDATFLQDDRTLPEAQSGRWRASIDYKFMAEDNG